jgi:hypothetical protein
MSVLATVGDVEELMQDTSLDDTYVTSVLTTVDLVLTKVYEYYKGVIGNHLLAEIQKYYAAHIIASTTSRMGQEEKVGDASIKYLGSYTSGLNSTPYGQMVLLLDTSGLIAKSNKSSASIYAVKSFD